MNENPISEILLGDHNHINNTILQIIKDCTPISPISDELYKNINWLFARHVYIEEKILYLLRDMIILKFPEKLTLHQELKSTVSTMISQHDSILVLIGGLNKNIDGCSGSFDFKSEFSIINSHVEFELEFMYAKFDKYLDMDDVSKLLSKIQGDLNKGMYPLDKLRSFYVEQ